MCWLHAGMRFYATTCCHCCTACIAPPDHVVFNLIADLSGAVASLTQSITSAVHNRMLNGLDQETYDLHASAAQVEALWLAEPDQQVQICSLEVAIQVARLHHRLGLADETCK